MGNEEEQECQERIGSPEMEYLHYLMENPEKSWLENHTNKVVRGDCLELIKQIPDKSIDLVLTDPPYGKMWTRGVNGIGLLKDKNEDDKTA